MDGEYSTDQGGLRHVTVRVTSSNMGLLMSLPLVGGLASVATSCLAGLAFCFTSNAGSFFTLQVLPL